MFQLLRSFSTAATRTKLKIPTKRCGALLEKLNRQAVEKHLTTKDIPSFRAGDAIELKMMLNKSSQTIQTYKGVVLGRRNRGINSSFKIRNHYGGVPVECTFDLYNPMIQSLKVLKEAAIHKGMRRVRRSKLYYLRDKPAKFTTV